MGLHVTQGGGASPGGTSGAVQTNDGAGALAGINVGAAGRTIVSNGSAWVAGALDLADADARTGTLPYGNGGTGLSSLGTGLQYLRVNAGATGMEWATLSTASPGGSTDEVQTNNGSGGFAGATNVKAGSSYVAINSSATTGALRLGGTGTVSQIVWRPSSTDFKVIETNSATPSIAVGDSTNIASVSINSYTSFVVQIGAQLPIQMTTSYLYVAPGGVSCFETANGYFSAAQPVAGYAGGSLPFRFKSASVAVVDGDNTLTAAQYECPFITLTGATISGFNVILPNTASATFNVKNNAATTATLKKSGGTGFTVTSGSTAWAFHNGTDYEKRG